MKIFITILYFIFQTAFALENLPSKSEGDYEVKFDYINHTKERKIAYELFCKSYNCEDKFSEVDPSDFGIDLYDIDQDGRLEILIYVSNPGFCGSRGCSFGIIKLNDSNFEKAEWVKWSNNSYVLNTYPSIKILMSNHLNYKDFMFENKRIEPSTYANAVWIWNGKFYEHVIP